MNSSRSINDENGTSSTINSVGILDRTTHSNGALTETNPFGAALHSQRLLHPPPPPHARPPTANATGTFLSSPIGRTHCRTPSPRARDVRKRIRTSGANTPLHDAVSSGATTTEIEALVEEDPDSILQQNPGGMTPLHCAIERYDTNLDTLLVMLSANPSAAAIRAKDGMNCIDLLWKRLLAPEPYRPEAIRQSAQLLQRALEGIIELPNAVHRQTSAERGIEEDSRLRFFWTAMCVFVIGACWNENNHPAPLPSLPTEAQQFSQQEQPHMLHNCVRLDTDPLLLRFVATLYPQQIRQPDPNRRSRLPLHLAARQSPRTLQTILALQPRLASARDGDGRLPLHLALENRHTEWACAVAPLIEAFPRSLTMVDPITGLLPAMQAATTQAVDTIFELLRADPMEVMSYALANERAR